PRLDPVRPLLATEERRLRNPPPTVPAREQGSPRSANDRTKRSSHFLRRTVDGLKYRSRARPGTRPAQSIAAWGAGGGKPSNRLGQLCPGPADGGGSPSCPFLAS